MLRLMGEGPDFMRTAHCEAFLNRTIEAFLNPNNNGMSGSEPTIRWSEAAPKFAWDGSLRDLLIANCTQDDWRHIFVKLQTLDGLKITWPRSATNSDILDNLDSLFSDEIIHSIRVEYCGIRLKCDLVSVDTIEFDLDPRDIINEHLFEALIRVMRTMSAVTKKPIVLTEEGVPKEVLIEISP